MNTQGWIKFFRSTLEWEWHDNPVMVSVWLHLLLMANHSETSWHGETIGRGQVVLSLHGFADLCGISVKQLRTAFERLEKSSQIVRKGANAYTLVTICNFDKYQGSESEQGQTDGKPRANEGQTKGKPRANEGQQYKNEENINKLINQEEKETVCDAHTHTREGIGFEVYGEFGNVQLKPSEHRALVERYGEDAVNEVIGNLSLKLADGSTQSIYHYATLLHWLSCRKSNIGGAARFARPAAETDPNRETSEQRTKHLKELWAQASEADKQEYLNTYDCYPWERKEI